MDEAGSSIRGSTKVPPSAGKSGSGKEDGAPKRTKRWKALAYKTILGRRIEIDIFPGGSDLYLPATVDSESLRPSWHVGVMFDQEPGSDAVRLDCVYEEIDLIHNKEISYRWLLDPPYGDSGKGPKPNLEAGSTIEVLYDNPEEFFAARVESFNKLTGKATLKYVDGVVEKVNLKDSELKYRILKSDKVLAREFSDNWKELALEATLGRRIEVANDDGDYFAATVDSKSLRPKSWSVRVTYDKHKSRASSPPSSEVLDLLHDKNIDYRWLLDPLYGGSGKDTKPKLKVGSTIEVLYDDPEKFFAARVESFNKLTGKATLIYDDEVVDQVNLKNSGLKYKILKSDEVLERYFNDEWKELALEAILGRRIEVEYDGDYFAATVDSESLRPKSWSVRVTYDKHKSRASSPPSSEVLDLLHEKSIDYRWLLDPLGVGSRVELLYDNPIKFFAGTISRFNRGTGKGTIVFDDGEINEVDLRDSFWKYRILKKDNRLLLLPNSGGKNKAPKLVVTKNTGNQAKNEVSRSRFDPAGFQRLENEFKQTPNPSMSRREELAREFNVPTQVVSNWFGRKRHEMKGKGIVSASTSGSRPLPSSSDPHRKNDREAAKGALITFGKENSKDTFDNVLMAVDKVVGKLVGARGEESLRASMRRRNKFTKKRRKTEATEERGRDRPAKVCVAAIQMSCTGSYVNNLSKAISEVYKAKKEGAHIVLLQELFTESYFPQVLDDSHFDKAVEYESSQLLAKMSEIAKDLEIVIPVSFFEVCNNAYFNSVCVIDADGERLGLYRKAHIPHSPGYEEKFYFSPGNTDFQVFETRYAKIGIGICWDQWYPEVARILALKGAELLLYPTAIGSEPQDSKLDSRMHWMRVMQGHAGANFLPIVASNRIGSETFKHYNDAVTKIDFYGHSFICGPTGEVVACAEREDRKVIVATFDLKEIQKQRRSWGLFRDRRPDLYEPLLTLDGHL